MATVFVGLWAVGVTVGAQGVMWLVDQILLATGGSAPAWAWPVTSVVNALLVGLPAALLATVPRSPAVRAAGRAWLLGALTLGALGTLRAVPLLSSETYLLGLLVLAALGALVLRHVGGRRWRGGADAAELPGVGPGFAGVPAPAGVPGSTEVPPPAARPPGRRDRAGAVALGIAAGLLVLTPWLWLGAAGGVTESVLAVLAAIAAGWLAAELLGDWFWGPYAAGGRARRVLVAGLVAGVALLLVGAGVGAAGPHLAVLLIFSALGFAAAALRAAGGRAAVWVMIAAAAAGPLAMVDPEEVSLLLLGRDVPWWTTVATGAAVLVAWLVGLALAATLPGDRTTAAAHPATEPVPAADPASAGGRPVGRPRPIVGLVTAVAVALGATAVYVALGQPGLHGDRLFVVMREQADLTGLPAGPAGLAGHGARVRAVHQALVRHADRTQAGLRRELDRLGLSYTPYYLVNAVEVDGGPAVREWLSRRADVDRVLLSQRLRPLPTPPRTEHDTAAAPVGPQWNITMIGADRARSELAAGGAGIVVGTSDSGVDGDHQALADGFRGGDDSWYDPWNATRAPVDHGGHGTHTLGSAVGDGGIGVAPDAQWIGCVNLDRNLGSPALYLDCLQFMLAPFPPGGDPFTDGRPERAPHVLTNSWGCPPLEGCDAGALRPATAAFAAAGIFFVAAAGNTGPTCGSVDDAPAPYADILTVGAVDADRRVTDFSSRGPTPDGAAKPDVVAPGARVLSALPGGGYGRLDGTSMAAPHVAGVVALVWSANPALVGDVAGTHRLLRDTAAPVEPVPGRDDCGGRQFLSGAGLVDAYAAVRAARSVEAGG